MTTLYYDLHLHSCLSPCGDADMTPANIAGMAFVNGLDLIALTDHNTTGNCAALKKAAAQYGITVLYGMELTTDEEVHVVCLFADEQAATAWNATVYDRLMRIENNPDIFGHQIRMDATDGVLGEEPYLLINAVALSFEEIFGRVEALGGVAFPAHVDKNANSLLSNLGFVPPDSTFGAAELHDLSTLEGLCEQHPYFKNCRILCNSDAHYLPDMHGREHCITVEDPSPAGILRCLRGEE